MKVQTVSSGLNNKYVNNYQNNHSNRVSFGFGIDYGDDDYLEAEGYVHKSGEGNIFGYFKLVGLFFYSWIKESIEDSRSFDYSSCQYLPKDADLNDTDDQVDIV